MIRCEMITPLAHARRHHFVASRVLSTNQLNKASKFINFPALSNRSVFKCNQRHNKLNHLALISDNNSTGA